MSQGLEISVTLLMNRFHGAEWPCSPSRLFRALVAGSMTGGNRRNHAEVEPALRWLESQKAPDIQVVSLQVAEKYRISVPNNDMDVAGREWVAGRTFDAAQLKTLKTVTPRHLSGHGPHIKYRWPDAQPDQQTIAGLKQAVDSLHTLGWGIDMAFADLRIGSLERSETETWSPSEKGPLLQIPVSGSLDDLHATYSRFLGAVTRAGVDADTRPSVYGLQRYSHAGLHYDHIEFEIIHVEEPRFRSYPAEHAMVLSAWLRHAASEALREEGFPEDKIDSLALGHNDLDRNPDRLVYLPICSVGFGYTDGRIRRVMIALRGMPEVLQSLDRKLNGRVLTDSNGMRVCRLVLSSDATKVTPQYLRSRHEWATVTPVVLHGYNASRGIISLHKTERLLAQAFEQAGHLPNDIEQWTFQPAPFWNRTPDARGTRVPQHLERWPRYHVWVRFRKKVSGPVLAGIGRHYGIGLFAGIDATS